MAFGAWVYVPADPTLERDQNREVDWIGAALITSGLSLLVFGLADGEGAPDGVCTFLAGEKTFESGADVNHSAYSGRLHIFLYFLL